MYTGILNKSVTVSDRKFNFLGAVGIKERTSLCHQVPKNSILTFFLWAGRGGGKRGVGGGHKFFQFNSASIGEGMWVILVSLPDE